MVFKRLIASMSGPICKCGEQKLRVDIFEERIPIKHGRDTGKQIIKHGLLITCVLCGTKLHIPSNELNIVVALDKKYSGGIKTSEVEKLDDGTVVDISDSFFEKLEAQFPNPDDIEPS